MKQYSPEIRSAIIALHKVGLSGSAIARKGWGSLSTVNRIIARFKSEGTYLPKSRPGLSKSTTARQDRYLVNCSLKDRTASSFQLRGEWQKVGVTSSARTVRRRLQQNGLTSRRPARKPLLSKKNIQDRLKFCRQYSSWTEEDWSRVIFSDESSFSCFANKGSIRVRRRPGERYKIECVVPTVKHPLTVHIWGCFSSRGTGALRILPRKTSMNSSWYLETLENCLVPTVHAHFQDDSCYFQDDNAPCHRSKVVKEWFQHQGIQLIQNWPGNSPDLNPIENLWAIIGKEVRDRHPNSRTSLEEVIQEAWSSPAVAQSIQKLISSMPKRIKATLMKKGHHSKY